MFSRRALNLFIICFIGFVDLVGVGLVYPMFSSMLYQPDSLLLPKETSEIVRGAYLGILLATMPLVQFFSAPLLGMLSDRYGRKKVIIPSLLVGCIGYLIAIFAALTNSLSFLILSRVGVGISAGTVAVINAAVADISDQENKSKNFGIINMATGLGFTMGPLLGGFLSGIDLGFVQGYTVGFLGAAFITSINLILVILFLEDSYVPKNLKECSLIQGLINIRKAFWSNHLQFVFASIFFACVGWSFYWEFVPVTWIIQYNFDALTIGNWYAYGAAVYALSCGILIRPIVSRFSTYNVLFYALVGFALSIALLLFHTDKDWLWIYIPIQQYCMALFWPTAATLISNSVSEEQQGEALGVLASVESLAFAISPLLAGPLLGLTTKMPLLVGSGTVFIAAWLLKISIKSSQVEAKTS